MRKSLALLLLLLSSNAQADVRNPVAFIGQYVFNAIFGAPLSTDSNGQLISGITGGKIANATADTSTTSTALMVGMTVTPPAGTYQLVFSTDVNSGSAGSIVTLGTFVGGTLSEQIKVMPFAGGTLTVGNQRIGISINDEVVVNGSQAITIQWSSSTAGLTSAAKRMTYTRRL